jgi:hypothetical protein
MGSLLSFLAVAVIVPNKAVKTNKTKQIKQYLPERLQNTRPFLSCAFQNHGYDVLIYISLDDTSIFILNRLIINRSIDRLKSHGGKGSYEAYSDLYNYIPYN